MKSDTSHTYSPSLQKETSLLVHLYCFLNGCEHRIGTYYGRFGDWALVNKVVVAKNEGIH